MGLFKVGGIDCSKRLRSRAADHTGVDKIRNFFQQLVLLENVGRVEERSGKHKLPVQGSGFSLEWFSIERFRVVDDTKLALRGQHFQQLQVMDTGACQTGNVLDRGNLGSLRAVQQRTSNDR